MSRSGRKKKRALFVVEILVLLIFIGGLFVYGQINAKLSKISTPTVENFDQEQVAVNISAPKLTGYTNVALFALDHRAKTESAGGENSDTIIIASINNDTKEVKLVSVYRDCLLDIGDDTYQKCNAAYSLGGPQKALSMLNTNLDLNLQDYVTVDFTAMVKAVDMLGGLDIPMTYQELVHMNNYCVETSEETETDYEPIPLPDPKPEDETAILDTYHLNGVQVTSYCRIRATASMDFGRTERQRMVIQMMVHKATKSSIATLSEIMDEVFPYVETSFSKSEIVKMALGMLSYRIDETTGFPQMIQMTDLPTKGSVVIPTTLESNVVELHKFLFSDDEYTPSDTVKSKSDTIVDLTGFGEGGEVVREGALSAVADALENEDSYGIQASPQDAASDENTTVTENTNT
ncbi:MAG: LCP family protein, partial [Eubacteriales bacterium]|nr:LCP family protein [Eubacteriales bacterium]